MNAVVNLLPTIVPKSDQLNADDLIGRSLTVTVTKVALTGEPDQPFAVHFEGDNGNPYKPCKSMRRVMVNVWGSDGNAFVGRRMTLYRDDKVAFGGTAVGGIRISHMSDIDRDVTMALTATRAQRKPYTVKPLPKEQARPAGMKTGADLLAEKEAAKPTLAERVAAFKAKCAGLGTVKLQDAWRLSSGLRNDLDAADPDEVAALTDWWQAAFDAAETREKGG